MPRSSIILLIILFILIASLVFLRFYIEKSHFLGVWVSDKYHNKIKIIQDEGNFYFIDHDDIKYTASLKDGKLSIDIGGMDAVAFYDKQTGKLSVSFMGDQETFSRPSK